VTEPNSDAPAPRENEPPADTDSTGVTESISAAEENHYVFALRRIYLHTVWLAIVGTIIAQWQGGPAWGLGFLLGATISAINFRWLHRLVDAIGPKPKKKPGRLLAAVLSSRYLLFGVVGYVIVRYFKVDIMAALVGLFVAVAAVLIEILYELIYVRT
jgi:hypothetical protein